MYTIFKLNSKFIKGTIPLTFWSAEGEPMDNVALHPKDQRQHR
jgi:hypothetical protein